MANEASVDDIGLNVGAIHALWTLHGLGQLDGSNSEATAAARRALNHPSAGVRRNAVQVLPPTSESTQALLSSGVLRDPNPQVRLAAVLALSDLPSAADAGASVLAVMNGSDAQDRWIQDAAISAAASHDISFLAALADSKQTVSARTIEAAAIVAEHFGTVVQLTLWRR